MAVRAGKRRAPVVWQDTAILCRTGMCRLFVSVDRGVTGESLAQPPRLMV